MKFKYRKLNLSPASDYFGKYILKPLIPVKIFRGENILQVAVLIDSGADFCIFDAEIGEVLALNVKSGIEVQFGGIQSLGGSKAYIHTVNLEIDGHEFKADVGFSYDISKNGYGILGQKGFFDKFIVKFDLIKEEIEIKERS